VLKEPSEQTDRKLSRAVLAADLAAVVLLAAAVLGALLWWLLA
jgi:hypothetical protein